MKKNLIQRIKAKGKTFSLVKKSWLSFIRNKLLQQHALLPVRKISKNQLGRLAWTSHTIPCRNWPILSTSCSEFIFTVSKSSANTKHNTMIISTNDLYGYTELNSDKSEKLHFKNITALPDVFSSHKRYGPGLVQVCARVGCTAACSKMQTLSIKWCGTDQLTAGCQQFFTASQQSVCCKYCSASWASIIHTE